MPTENIIQVNTGVDTDTSKMLDTMCEIDERNRSQMVRWLIRQEYARRFSQPSLMTIEEAEKAMVGK